MGGLCLCVKCDHGPRLFKWKLWPQTISARLSAELCPMRTRHQNRHQRSPSHRYPDRDVCETFKRRNDIISSFISVLLSAYVGVFSQVPAGIRSGPAEPGGWTNADGEFQTEDERWYSPNWAHIPVGPVWSRVQMSIITFLLAETDQLCVCLCVCLVFIPPDRKCQWCADYASGAVQERADQCS